jgi:hypothetical protein
MFVPLLVLPLPLLRPDMAICDTKTIESVDATPRRNGPTHDDDADETDSDSDGNEEVDDDDVIAVDGVAVFRLLSGATDRLFTVVSQVHVTGRIADGEKNCKI